MKFVYIIIRGMPRSICNWRRKVELLVFLFLFLTFFIFLPLDGDDLEPLVCLFSFSMFSTSIEYFNSQLDHVRNRKLHGTW